MTLRVIGDVHGLEDAYLHIVERAEQEGIATVQLGDMGFDYEHLKGLDSLQHVFIPGNHDNYDLLANVPHSMDDDYGSVCHGGIDFFFVRGAYSIDKALRTEGVSWWADEEVSMEMAETIIATYTEVKPDLMITHDAPEVAAEAVMEHASRTRNIMYNGFPIKTRTGQLLTALLNIHTPKMWIFGHYHHDWQQTIQDCRFICLDELSCMDIEHSHP